MTYMINFLLNIFVRFGNKVFRQIVGIPMGTNCAPLIADLFLYCYESQFMAKLQKDLSKHSRVSLFSSNCRYLDDIFTANNPSFLTFVNQIYHKEHIFGFGWFYGA